MVLLLAGSNARASLQHCSWHVEFRLYFSQNAKCWTFFFLGPISLTRCPRLWRYITLQNGIACCSPPSILVLLWFLVHPSNLVSLMFASQWYAFRFLQWFISHDWQNNLKAPCYFLQMWHWWIWTIMMGNATSSQSTKQYNSQHQSTCIIIFKSAVRNKLMTTLWSEGSSRQDVDVWFIWRFGILYAHLQPAWVIKAYGSAEASIYCGSSSKQMSSFYDVSTVI